MYLRTIHIALVAAFGVSISACKSESVGDPCIPEDEYENSFSGFSDTEVNIESRSFQCETRICLVDHFRGRVSCPYGQNQAQVDAKNPKDPAACRIPGTNGDQASDLITAVVNPQWANRRPVDSVYCSCRCDGPDPNAKYCECPDGFDCKKLVDDLGFEGTGQLAGSYCQKQGHDALDDPPAQDGDCVLLTGNCGGKGNPPFDGK